MSNANNLVVLCGRVSRAPQSVPDPARKRGHVLAFPLAVRQDDGLVFPMIIARALPESVTFDPQAPLHEQPLITVIGYLRTRNVTRELSKEVTALARRAGATNEVVAVLEGDLGEQVAVEGQSRRVVTEVVATSISDGGAW